MGALPQPEGLPLPAVDDTLRRVIDAIPCLVFSARHDGHVDFLNVHWVEFTGLKLEELRGWGWRTVLHPEDVGRFLDAWHAALARGGPLESEARVRRMDGAYCWFLIRIIPLPDEQGNILRWYGTGHDIEDYKRAEARIRQSEAELRQVLDFIPVHVFVLESDAANFVAGIHLPNRQALEYTGLTLQEIRADPTMIFHPEDVERLRALRQRALSEGMGFEAEARVRRKDGQYRWFLIRVNPLRDDSGRILRWYGTRVDIQDRKQAEDYLRLVIDTIPQQIWSGPADGSVDFGNIQWRSYMGFTPEELQGEGWQRMLHPDDRDRVLTAWRESVATGKPYEQEERHRGAEGQYRWFLSRGVPLKDSEGRIVRWYGTNTDIEDRREAENRLRLVVDTTPAMLYSARPDGYLDFFNKRWLDYLDLSLDDICGWRWTAAIHSEDLDELLGKWRSALASGAPYEHEARVRRGDGEYRWMLLRKVPLRDEGGNITKWYGSGTDVEEQHQARAALLKAFNEIKALRDQLYKENLVLKEKIVQASIFEEMIGSSAALRSVLVHVEKVAPTDSTVLITGETGTGKELVARAIHKRSNRASQAFVSVNCAAIPPL